MNRVLVIFVSTSCWILLALAGQASRAGVAVVQNWTPGKVEFVLRQADGRQSRHSLVPTDVMSVPTAAPVIITLGEGPVARDYPLPVNSVHYFGMRKGEPEIVRLRLPGTEEQTPGGTPAEQGGRIAQQPGQPPSAEVIYKIPVALYTDAADPGVRAAWEKRVRKRLEETSDIFEHHCRVRFEAVTVGSWASDASVHSFDQSLMEFMQKVRPFPARLAIGFTTHYEWIRGETHLGGTHGALASHILIRESPGQVSEPERLEVLVHELGHFLGAAHTSDKSSVMRPKLGDRQSAARSFRIGFDAPNTLIMCLVAEEMRTRNLWHPSALSPAAKTAVRGAYMALAETIPQDPVSTSAVESLGPPPQPANRFAVPAADQIAGPGPEVIFGARRVLQAVVQAARENQHLPVSSKDPHAAVWRTDDDLTACYVRRAAAAARQLRPQAAPAAFLLGLGAAMDDFHFVRDKPALNEIWQKVEPEDQREGRLLLLGTPTMLKRHNVARHFTISAALVVLCGPQGAEAAGLGKELVESRGGDGFSFADLCADMAGVMFASHVMEGNIPLDYVAARFQVEDFMPKLDELPADLTSDAFVKQYGEAGSEAFQRQRAEIFHRILALPAYRAPVKSVRKK